MTTSTVSKLELLFCRKREREKERGREGKREGGERASSQNSKLTIIED